MTVFGESWLVAEAPPDLTVRVESETAAVYALDRRVYRALVGGARDPPHRRAELFLPQPWLLWLWLGRCGGRCVLGGAPTV